MKRIFAILFALLILPGCGNHEDQLDRAMALRTKLLAQSVAFDVNITADYGDTLHNFSVSCQSDTNGTMTFTVTKPETIAGITGSISAAGGKLTFDDQAIAFDLLAEGQLSPIAAPWVFIKALRSGYLTSSGNDGEYLRLTVDDSYADDAMHLDIWLGQGDLPVRAEILWKGRRLLSMDVGNFHFL
jgi:hypothetical protein